MNNPHAFPFNHFDLADGEHGMTLRDYFAAKAMRLKFGQVGDTASLEQMAAWCYEMADAMLEARK